MRTLILLLMVAVVRKSYCEDIPNLNKILGDIFGQASDVKNIGNNEESTEETELCGVIKGSDFGTRTSFGTRITIDGTDSRYTQYPWMVALYRHRKDKPQCTLDAKRCWRYEAGGSVINMNVVLTAAHNVLNLRQNHLKARAGDWDLKSTQELYAHEERFIKKIIIHPRFKDSKLANHVEYDAALLVLETPFIHTDNIAPVCLPPPNLVDSSNCKTAGWGKLKPGDKVNFQNTLKVVDLNPVDNDACNRALSGAVKMSIHLHESFMCAGGIKGKDSCHGDGGSPLMCIESDYYYQRGIVSWGIGCGEEGIPGVYSDVVKIRKWIDDQMYINGFDPKSYTYVPDNDS